MESTVLQPVETAIDLDVLSLAAAGAADDMALPLTQLRAKKEEAALDLDAPLLAEVGHAAADLGRRETNETATAAHQDPAAVQLPAYNVMQRTQGHTADRSGYSN